MRQITVSEGVEIFDRFEREMSNMGLVWRRLNLKKYPGCIHWHITIPGQKGTLEATYIPEGKRLWFEVRVGREAPWQDDAVSAIQNAFGRA